MKHRRQHRTAATALVIGVVAVGLATVVTVTQTRPAESSQTETSATTTSTGPSSAPVPAPPSAAAGAALGVGPPRTAALQDVAFDADGVLRIDGHVVVNKSFAVPETFGSGGLDPNLVSAFDAMAAEASAAGVSLWIVSGYRSYARQADNYMRRVASVGQETADRGMARPGHSEHQTGLAIDVNELSTSFGQTPAGQWLAANAHRFGFVIRYPEGKEDVTGFKYEPWHLRYFGVELATELATSGLTFEEYFNLPSSY